MQGHSYWGGLLQNPLFCLVEGAEHLPTDFDVQWLWQAGSFDASQAAPIYLNIGRLDTVEALAPAEASPRIHGILR